jgi:hypothetical protein
MPKKKTSAAMLDAPARDWLLAVLRYAVTREEADRATVLVLAEAMDLRGADRTKQSSFEFFRRSSIEFCRAIVDHTDPRRPDIIRGYLRRIDNQRLRRAIEAAVDLPDQTRSQQTSPRRRLNDRQLWKGLT